MMRIREIIVMLTILLGTAVAAHGQHYIGVRGGTGAGLGRFYPATQGDRQNQKLTWGLHSGGVAWKYYSPEKYLGGVGAEIEFLQRGYEYHLGRRNSDTTYRRTVNSINVPLMWQPHVNMANNHLRVFLNLGIAVSYNFSSRQDTLARGEGVIHTAPYEMMLVRDNPFGFGLQGGIGFNIIFGKFEFSAEGRYYFTYGDIMRNRTKYPGPTSPSVVPLRSPVDNINISVGVFYRLGNKPHAPPLGPRAIKRQQEKMALQEARQLEKIAKKNGNDKTAKSSQANTEGY